MRIVVVGAGAVGLVLAARLSAAGHELLCVVRRPEVAAAIEAGGIELRDPATGTHARTRVRTAVGLATARGWLQEAPVLLCTRAAETTGVARTLAAVTPEAYVVSAQNDVDNERELAGHLRQVAGLVVRQTCTRSGLASALASGPGRVVLGRHPQGFDSTLESLAAAFESADFDTGRSHCIAEDKWLKLCVNLTSTANALVRREEHTTPAFVEAKIRVIEEARSVLAAAGIAARSCDGRDRSLETEIEHLRNGLAQGTSARALPLTNAVWAALAHPGRALEADLYHRRILDLAAARGLAAPANARTLEVLLRTAREGRGPESCAANDLLPRV
jgi:2-dehydropantoate 2-reductase